MVYVPCYRRTVVLTFENIPKVDTNIVRQTSWYIGKAYSTLYNFIPKELLRRGLDSLSSENWKPQKSCIHHFLKAIQAVVPEVMITDFSKSGYTA